MCQAVGPCPHCAIKNHMSACSRTYDISGLISSYFIHHNISFNCSLHVPNCSCYQSRPCKYRLIEVYSSSAHMSLLNRSVFIVLTCVLIVSGWPHSILWLTLCVPVSCIELRNCSRKFIAYRPFGAYRFCISVLFLLMFVASFCFVLFSILFSLFLCFSLFLTKIESLNEGNHRTGC